MNKKFSKKLSEQEIDQIVISQADKDSEWDKPVKVHKIKNASITIPANLTARATFLAKVHKTKNVEEWLTHVIKERIELEEAAYAGVKNEIIKNY